MHKKYKISARKLEDLKAARGKPESSIVADIELTLAKFLISWASYHGGNVNGVYCLRIVQNSNEVMS
jgi:hypothetical protein